MAHFAVVVLSLTLLLLSPPLASATFSAVGGVLASRKHPKILVSGHVFCDQCRQGLSSQLTVPLPDAEVGVTCVDVYGFVTYNAVAYTSPDGSFKIPLDDLPPLYGVKGCKAHLVASGDFNCNLASSVGGGAAGAKLVLNSRSLEEVIFTSGPFAYHPSRPLRLCSPMSPSPPVTHRRLSPPPPAPSVRKHKSPPPPSGPKHKGKTPPSAAISYPPPPPSKPGQKKHKSPPPPATLKYRFPPGQAQPPPKPVNHGSKTPAPDKRRPRSPKRQPPPAPDKQNAKSPKPQPPAPSPVKAEKRKPPPPPRDHKPQPPSSVSPDQPVPPPHHGHQGHKSSPPAPPGYVYPSPPPPHHGHQGHPLPPPPSPGYVYTPPPPPHHGNEGHKDGKSPPKHNLPPLPQAPVPPPISR